MANIEMDWETIRPLVTGVIGGLLSVWVLRKWARFVPRSFQSKSRDKLLEEHRLIIRIANVIFFGTIIFGIYLFKVGYVTPNSWHHFLLIVGIAITAPVAVVILTSVGNGWERVAEVITALAIAERTPVPVLLGIVAIGVIILAIGLGKISW